MRLYFQHTAGRITNTDWQYTPVYATFEEFEKQNALETGWLPHEYEEDLWFQARQVRYCLKELSFAKRHKIPLRIDFEIVDHLKNWSSYEEIWDTYLEKKGFPSSLALRDLFKIDPEDKRILEVYDYDELVAFSILRMEPAPVSLQFAWTYHDPKLSLGIHCQYFELNYFKDLGYAYNYVCPGYERTCIWKSRFPGFEFWTGTTWSQDKTAYAKLCERDSNLKEMDDLEETDMLPMMRNKKLIHNW